MLATPVLRAGRMPGFWKRSMDELKRQATIAVRLEGLSEPQRPYPLIKFDKADSIPQCKVMCDSTSFGGYSRAELTFVPGSQSSSLDAKDADPPHALFKGSISTALPPNKPEVQRSGFAAWRTHDRGVSLFGKLLWDIDPYTYLALRVKSDGRKYFINIQTESIVPTDIHQHLLSAHTPGEWETVVVPFNAFVRTNHGMVVEPQREMMRQKLRSIGIGSTDRVEGPFELRIAEIYATNNPPSRTAVDSGFDIAKEEPKKEPVKEEEEKIMI